MQISDPGLLIYGLICFFLISSFTAFLVNRYLRPNAPKPVFVFSYFGWFLAFSVSFLVPIEFLPASYNTDLTIVWEVISIISMVLSWLVGPMLSGYYRNGGFSFFQKVFLGLRFNFLLLTAISAVGLILVFYLRFANNDDWDQIFAILLLLNNVFGLLLLIFLAGYGLVAVPRELWRNANRERTLDEICYHARNMCEDMEERKDELASFWSLMKEIEGKLEKKDKYLDVTEETTIIEMSTRNILSPSLVGSVFEEKADHALTIYQNKKSDDEDPAGSSSSSCPSPSSGPRSERSNSLASSSASFSILSNSPPLSPSLSSSQLDPPSFLGFSLGPSSDEMMPIPSSPSISSSPCPSPSSATASISPLPLAPQKVSRFRSYFHQMHSVLDSMEGELEPLTHDPNPFENPYSQKLENMEVVNLSFLWAVHKRIRALKRHFDSLNCNFDDLVDRSERIKIELGIHPSCNREALTWWQSKGKVLSLRLASLICFLMTAVILFCEVTLAIADLELSPIRRLLTRVSASPTAMQLVSIVPLLYLTACSFYPLWQIRVSRFYYLTRGRTNENTILKNVTAVLRVSMALALNFILLLLDDGAMKKILPRVQEVPFFGSDFNHIFPLFIAVVAVLVWFDIVSLVCKLLNIPRFRFLKRSIPVDSFDASSTLVILNEADENVADQIEEGKRLIEERLRKRAYISSGALAPFEVEMRAIRMERRSKKLLKAEMAAAVDLKDFNSYNVSEPENQMVNAPADDGDDFDYWTERI